MKPPDPVLSREKMEGGWRPDPGTSGPAQRREWRVRHRGPAGRSRKGDRDRCSGKEGGSRVGREAGKEVGNPGGRRTGKPGGRRSAGRCPEGAETGGENWNGGHWLFRVKNELFGYFALGARPTASLRRNELYFSSRPAAEPVTHPSVWKRFFGPRKSPVDRNQFPPQPGSAMPLGSLSASPFRSGCRASQLWWSDGRAGGLPFPA